MKKIATADSAERPPLPAMSVKERGKKLKGQLTAKILLLNDEVRQTEAKPPAPAPHHVASKEF